MSSTLVDGRAEPMTGVDESGHSGRRALVVSYHFAPQEEVGALRWSALARYLADLGWQVEVITWGDQDSVEEFHPGVKVYRVAPSAIRLSQFYPWLRQRMTRPKSNANSKNAGSKGSVGRSAPRKGGLVRQLARFALEGPDYARGWLIRGARAARKRAKAFRPDIVVSSSPPHSTHLVGKAAARAAGAPHVVDLRDPWYTGHPNGGPNAVVEATLKNMEASVFSTLAAAVVNTEAMVDVLGRRLTRPAYFVPNGFDPAPETEVEEVDASEPFVTAKTFLVSYVGTLYYNRDLGKALEAFRQILNLEELQGQPAKFLFAGKVDGTHVEKFDALVNRLEMGEAFAHLGLIPRSRAIELTKRSDIALVLAQGQPVQIPAKIYECAALARRTLVVAEKESASYVEAVRLGLRAVATDDIEGLISAYRDALTGGWPQDSAGDEFHYRTVADRMNSVLNNVVSQAASETAAR